MRLAQLAMALLMTIVAVPAFGQYYLFDADENGATLEYAWSDEDESKVNAVGLTLKIGEHSGVSVAYAKADHEYGLDAESFALGFEQYFSPKNRAASFPAAVLSTTVANQDFGSEQSYTAIIPGLALSYISPVTADGRNISAAGLSLSIPLRSSAGVNPDVTAVGFVSSTQTFRMSPSLRLILGLAYGIDLNEKSGGTLQFKIGLALASKKEDDF
ncbi:MAG: hypothetical protein GY867_00075 [bacterium]|nr:hypothetical protein [bacterium]